MGGKLKAAEFISGRFADVLSNIYLGYAVLWHHQKFPAAGSDVLVHYAMQNILCDAEEALFGVYENFPVPGVGVMMRAFTSPTGRCYSRPSDELTRKASQAITTETGVRAQLLENLYLPTDVHTERTAQLHAALGKCIKADAILAKCRKEKREPSTQEKADIDAAEAMRETIIQVDSFSRLGIELNQGEEWTHNMRPGVTVKAEMAERAARSRSIGAGGKR